MRKTLITGSMLVMLSSSLLAMNTGHASEQTLGRLIDDTTLTAKMRAELLGNDTLRSSDIKIETRDGVVQLSGFVNSETEKELAEALAEKLREARDVENDIIVQPGRTNADPVVDARLTATVKGRFMQDDAVRATAINVNSSGGVVQLSGFAASEEEKNAAERIAGSVEGVQDVENDIITP
jgi:hyperosmotically inducible protein